MKKQVIIIALILGMGAFFGSTVYAQWDADIGVVWTMDKVGINTNAPDHSLYIFGNTTAPMATQEKVIDHISGSALLMRKARGTVGARTKPINNDVIGGLFGQVWANNNWAAAASIRFFADGDVTDAAANGKIQFQVQDGGLIGANMRDAMTIRHTGAVGVGTDEIPDGFLFAVNGKVIAEELQIQLKGEWPDFVFDADYDLMSLNELEGFVKTNRHLPGIPNENEVKEQGGVNLGEISTALLQKVEELTLYVIELNKQKEELERRIVELEK